MTFKTSLLFTQRLTKVNWNYPEHLGQNLGLTQMPSVTFISTGEYVGVL